MDDTKIESNIEVSEKGESTVVVNKGPMIGMRHIQTMMMFLLLTIGYSMRVNLSVGIVAMTHSSSPNPDIKVYKDWDDIEGMILSSFYMGYILLQIPAGELGKRYGVKWFVVIAMAINSVGSILTPLMADSFGAYGVMAIRMLQGSFQGFFFPSCHNIMGKWAPKEERSTLGNFIFTGVAFGTIITMPVTGWISGSWLGWPAAFYLFGSVGLGWCVLWAILGANSPEEHTYISEAERNYIQTSLETITETKAPPTPWKAIFTSMPVWAIVVANSGQNWGYATLLTEISNYLANVANLKISDNALLSAAPYFALFVFGLGFGPAADWIIAKKYLTPAQTRKLMNSIGLVTPAVALTILGFVPPDNIAAIIALLIIAVGINGAVFCGFQVNHVDLSPTFSGILMGIGNGSSNIFSIISPNVVDLIVHDKKDPTQWRIVFLIAAAIYVASDIFYVIFAQAERQSWDRVDDHGSDQSTKVADDNGNLDIEHKEINVL